MVTALHPLDGAVPTYEDAAAWKGLRGGFPSAAYKPTLLPTLCFLHQTAWRNTCTWVVHFRGVQGSLNTPLRFYVYSSPRSLTHPLWKANVHNTCHVHLEPGHLVGTQGRVPGYDWWQLLFHQFVLFFLFFHSWTLNPAYDSIGFETYIWHWQVNSASILVSCHLKNK